MSQIQNQIKMIKLFFVITLCSSVILWYLHEYHTVKFLQLLQTVPYYNVLANKIHVYIKSSSPMVPPKISTSKIFTSEELKAYNGENDSKGIYIAILGEVYNVQKGQRHYGPGGPYHIFAGRDASRSFVTGDFERNNPTDHVLDLSLEELLSLRHWSEFYKREYEYKGKLSGRYYDDQGRKTKYLMDLQEKFNEAEKKKKDEKDDEVLFPPCNVEWNAETGTKVWCSKKRPNKMLLAFLFFVACKYSGGIHRNWSGVPRKLYIVGSESYRCACVNIENVQKIDSPQYAKRGHIQHYQNCDPSNHVCFVKE